jgi:hypothetical protein
MPAIRFHVPTTVARAIGLTRTGRYPGGADDVSGDVEVTDLPWMQVTAIECSIPIATRIVADIERASGDSINPGFRAHCASAMDSAEMAILDGARSHRPALVRTDADDGIGARRTVARKHAPDHRDHH